MASAALVVTVDYPTDGQQINNTGSNIATYDINFTITDNNSFSFDTNGDYNVNIVYYPGSTGKLWNGGTGNDANVTYVVRDGNINDWNRNGNGTRRCTGIRNTSMKCRYLWTIPDNSVMGNGNWVLDVNVFQFGKNGAADYTNSDDNGSATLWISNRLATMDTAKTIAGLAPVAVIGMFFIALFGALFVAKTDIKTAILAGVGGGIVGGLGSMLFGLILSVI